MGNPAVLVGFKNGLSMRQDGPEKFGAFFHGKVLDWFPDDKSASKLIQDISISLCSLSSRTFFSCATSFFVVRMNSVVA